MKQVGEPLRVSPWSEPRKAAFADAPLSAKVPGYSRLRRGLSTSATPSFGRKNMGQNHEARFFLLKSCEKS
jgi:hypothetical protein